MVIFGSIIVTQVSDECKLSFYYSNSLLVLFLVRIT